MNNPYYFTIYNLSQRPDYCSTCQCCSECSLARQSADPRTAIHLTQCTLNTEKCRLYSVHCTVYNIQYTLCTASSPPPVHLVPQVPATATKKTGSQPQMLYCMVYSHCTVYIYCTVYTSNTVQTVHIHQENWQPATAGFCPADCLRSCFQS